VLKYRLTKVFGVILTGAPIRTEAQWLIGELLAESRGKDES
jgi:hypothetical protein